MPRLRPGDSGPFLYLKNESSTKGITRNTNMVTHDSQSEFDKADIKI